MDVQMENMDPPLCESQPSGKIRKGFKLFGKRKPGNIFSLKSNKSPVTRSRTVDGLPDGAVPDYELEADKEKAREVSQGDGEHAEEEPTGEDGVLAAARNSISSSGSVKSLRFFSRLRGARRGGGDRKVHTVSQPVTQQRHGLKGLFGSMTLRPKDKDDKEEAFPSPLLMSSRSNSVEIIKEDIGLTPKSPPRSLESREKASSERSPIAAGDVSSTDEDAAPVPATEPPVVATESSLGSLLDDISSLLTFESISGGDIMADMKAEWGRARCASSPKTPEVSALASSPSSKPDITSPLTSASVTTSSSPVAAGTHSITYSDILAVSKELPSIPATGQSPISQSRTPLSPVSVSTDPPVPASAVSMTTPVSVPKSPPAPVQIPVTQSKSPVLPATSFPATTPVPLPSEAAASNNMNAIEPSTNGQLSCPSSTNGQTSTVEEQHNGSRMDLPKERKTQVKALSKIPVVGGGRAGKLPVRDSQHTDDDSSRDPPTPIEEDRRHLDFHNTGNRDKGGSVEVHVPTFKHSQEESQPLHQSKAPAGVPRDSKIPVKHGTQSPPASQIPQAKETPRTKIPVSRVPVRRVGNKPTTSGVVRKL
ncbi:APC membrane recruitment protein 2-like [Phyllopteryx taeniolatus]|uniref:APC membrane recruitment protein 2-like n=1 Tax=Phyllopteryx taeniolatus TaxID=161469 RepID=UPI002AD4D0BF|nr:APC membrane recruitment protein 2-like [Phyllopteryx taeniolatus]